MTRERTAYLAALIGCSVRYALVKRVEQLRTVFDADEATIQQVAFREATLREIAEDPVTHQPGVRFSSTENNWIAVLASAVVIPFDSIYDIALVSYDEEVAGDDAIEAS